MELLMALGNIGNFVALIYFLGHPGLFYRNRVPFAFGAGLAGSLAYREVVAPYIDHLIWGNYKTDCRPEPIDELFAYLSLCGCAALAGTLAVQIKTALLGDTPPPPAQQEDWLVRTKR